MSEQKISALKVHQWLKEWEKVKFTEVDHRRKPKPYFYIFTLNAQALKKLSGIYRRSIQDGLQRSLDLNIQRRHEPKRSKKIHEFVKFGYPWSELSDAHREQDKHLSFRKPGWLPTAIVVNILEKDEKRRGEVIDEKDLIKIIDSGDGALIKLPQGFENKSWDPKVRPLEVIDGQHRLWAFDDPHKLDEEFELPVVAFCGLDISWQAYLFWSINISPKKINTSLAYDLYPLLRTEDWLDKLEGHVIYREIRSQELTESLWGHTQSPWFHKINMLGEPGQQSVSQAAWIRALMATYVKQWEGQGITIGGLFGTAFSQDKQALPWTRPQQAAFLIFLWKKFFTAVTSCSHKWAKQLRAEEELKKEEIKHVEYFGKKSLINTDQGIRGFLFITNDLFFTMAKELNLEEWQFEDYKGEIDESAIEEALKDLNKKSKIVKFTNNLVEVLSSFDWRTSSVEGLSEKERMAKLVLRGGSGYKELRRQLLVHVSNAKGNIGSAALEIMKKLKY